MIPGRWKLFIEAQGGFGGAAEIGGDRRRRFRNIQFPRWLWTCDTIVAVMMRDGGLEPGRL
jgi:hypothetical protein